MNTQKPVTVGLFGTCGNSTWRTKFIEVFNDRKINYFNPQVENWTPECAEIEAKHLVEDDMILFPITDETTGLGSLAETGFSILQTLKFMSDNAQPRMLIVFIDKNCKIDDPVLKKESTRARALVRAHLKKFKTATVIEVNSLDEMLTKAVIGVDVINSWKFWLSDAT